MIILKIGGSVVTEKDRRATVDQAAMERVSQLVGEGPGDIVVVHGGGSFGHPVAAEYGVSDRAGTRDAGVIRDIHEAMKRLNERIINSFAQHELSVLPVHPLSFAARDRAGSLRIADHAVRCMVDEGFVPVTHGDVIVHEGAGATIVSGDELVVALARALGAQRVGMCTSVPGVLDEDDEVIRRVESFDQVAHVLVGSTAADVTGSMAGKVQALLELDLPAWIFGIDGLGSFLAGGSPGTRIA